MHYASVSIRLEWCIHQCHSFDWCVGVKIKKNVFNSYLPESWLCASCPPPAMTQCPSAPQSCIMSQLRSVLYSSLTLTMRYWHDYCEWHKWVWTCSTTCGGCSNLTISCVFIWFCFWNIIMRLDVLLGLKTEWEFGEKWISNIKERVEKGKKTLSSESGPQKLPCARVQPWNQPDPIDSVYLARLQVKAIGNLGEIWRGLWIRRKKKNEQKNNTVCSTVWQSRRVFRSAFNKVNGDFSPQAPFYCKSLIFACFICVIFTLFSFHFSLFSSSPLPTTTVPAAASHHFCFSMLTPCFLAHYRPQPPNAAVLNSSRFKTLF